MIDQDILIVYIIPSKAPLLLIISNFYYSNINYVMSIKNTSFFIFNIFDLQIKYILFFNIN